MPQRGLCLVTIHGIGFEQAPENGAPGYADGLHERLSRALGPDLLSDDPNRSRPEAGKNGAVYVQSLWAPQAGGPDQSASSPPQPSREEGLRRLGSWISRPDRTIDTSGAPLFAGSECIAHVALVYSRLEAVGPHVGAAAVAMEMAAVSFGHYASIMGLARMAFTDIEALVAPHRTASTAAAPSLRVRTDTPAGHHWFRLPFGHGSVPAGPSDPTSALATVRNLENDVAAYVSRNDLRERVRSFVREALLRLASREDVAGVAVNAHSNGTVIGFDVVRDLPPFLAEKVQLFVTAGSPLRKYAELFNWGTEVGGLKTADWLNFWDSKDPVADPLAPPPAWRRGDPLPPVGNGTSLYHDVAPDTGLQSSKPIEDLQVDNIGHGGSGGLPAHDYWDNDQEVVRPLADRLRQLCEQAPPR